MPGFISLNNLVTSVSNGQITRNPFMKTGTTSTGGTIWHSTWNNAGNPGAGVLFSPVTPGGAHYSNTALGSGALPLINTGTLQQYGLSLGGTASLGTYNIGIFDRLVGVGGITLNSSGSKTINSVALPRYTSGYGVQAFLEVTVATSTTAVSATMTSYTNENGVAGRAGNGGIVFSAAATNIGDVYGPFPLQAGDNGIQSVANISITTAAGAGQCNLILVKPLAFVPLLTANIWNEKDFILQLAQLPRIYDGACLYLMSIGNTAATTVSGNFRTVYG